MSNLLDTLKDQAAFGFTGKINVLLASTGQFQGVIYQQEGFIVGAQFAQLKDKKALFKMIFEDVESSTHFKFIVEPEVLKPEVVSFNKSFDEIKLEAETIYQRYLSAKKLKPAPHLKLMIDPEVIVNQTEITPEEYDILSVLAEWCRVSDVYKYSKLMEFDVTNALVSLRRKKAIKVFQNEA